MRDGDLVAAVVAGDPAALAAAYDQFAPELYGYCRSLLSEPADAAGAVRDTFVVAEVELPLLRDPSRLRPWLYAVARNECRRRLHGDGASVPLTDDEFGAGEATADLGPALEQARQRELVSSALAGLNPADREIIELSLRHEFYGADLADALGVPRNQAHALTTRAQSRFETALGALMVARSSQGSCQELSWILGDWDGDLTPHLRKQVRQHIGTCEICGEHRRRQVNPVALLSALPEPVLPESLQHEALSLLADTSPDAARERAQIAGRAEPFSRSGFPVPLDPLASRRGPAAFVPAAGVLVAVFAMFGGGAMLAANSLHHTSPPVSSALAPSVPSTNAAPAVNTPKPTTSRSGHKKHGKHGAVAASGTGFYTPGAGKSGKSSKPGSHPSSAAPSKTRHTSPPSSSPPSPTPPSTPPTTPPDTPTPTPTGTSGSTSILGTIIGWL
ncbi:MAG TPA: sigma-70 family RNA polymerase sigma factor [Streptosporangiaceae bacterium]|nr:sigma-70 family RNA polymerase sigma factor [Streptosporangiaceae bacterium]